MKYALSQISNLQNILDTGGLATIHLQSIFKTYIPIPVHGFGLVEFEHILDIPRIDEKWLIDVMGEVHQISPLQNGRVDLFLKNYMQVLIDVIHVFL